MRIKLIGVFFAGILLLPSFLAAQQDDGDWDTYVLYAKDRPSSVMVDLGFAGSPAAKSKLNVIIVSLQLAKTQPDGLPIRAEVAKLDTLESALVNSLAVNLSASYTGRFTSNGKRDFYFYSNDTSNNNRYIKQVVEQYPPYRFSTIVKADPSLSNYLNVLYPTPIELQRINNRRMTSRLADKGDALTAPRKISHFLFFKTEKNRKAFAQIIQDKRFTIDNFGEEKGVKDRPYSLEISRIDRVDEDNIDEVSLYLWELALKFGGRYDGWETFPVVTP